MPKRAAGENRGSTWMRYYFRCRWPCIALLVSVATAAHAQDSALVGVKAVAVDIESNCDLLLDSAHVRTVSELAIRRMGLQIEKSSPLRFRVSVSCSQLGLLTDEHTTAAAEYALDFRGSLVEPMYTATRRTHGAWLGPTWHREQYPVVIAGLAIRKTVDSRLGDLFEQFENDWLAANPRRAARPPE